MAYSLTVSRVGFPLEWRHDPGLCLVCCGTERKATYDDFAVALLQRFTSSSYLSRQFAEKMKYILLLILLPTLCWANFVELTDQKGRSIQAELLDNEMGHITIEKESGDRFKISVDTLSEESQRLVEKTFEEKKKSSQKRIGPSNPNPLKIKLDFNSTPPEQISIAFFNSETRKKISVSIAPTDREVDISDLEDGDYVIDIKADGYAFQWSRGNLRNGRFSPRTLDLDLRKERFVVMRYAINLDSTPNFEGDALYTGIAAFSDLKWGNPQHFLGWRIRQADLGEKRYGDDFILQWKWMVRDSGLCEREDDFDDIKTAEGDKFRCKQIKLEKGVVFTCKSSYSRNPDLYGKFEVIDIVDEPSEDLEVY